MFDEYPQEFFLSLESGQVAGDASFLEARITLNLLDSRFSVEMDLVQRESRKIWKHLGILGPFSPNVTKDEAIDQAVQTISFILRGRA